jgi:predicted nucleic acid-binding protein
VLIAYERATIDRESFDDDELSVAALSLAEYRVGIELADTVERAVDRARALTQITSVIAVLDYTETTAAHHAQLLAHTRRVGSPRSAHDLIIAAHAAQSGRTIVSHDAAARFGQLPGVPAVTAPLKVQAAIAYYADFTDEVDDCREQERDFERRERERQERAQRVLG